MKNLSIDQILNSLTNLKIQSRTNIRIKQIRRDIHVYVNKLNFIYQQIDALREYLCPECRKLFDAFMLVVKDELEKFNFLKDPIRCIQVVGSIASKYGINEAYKRFPFWSKSRISKIKHAYEVLNDYLHLFEDLDLTLDHFIEISYEIENYQPLIRPKMLKYLVQLLKSGNFPKKIRDFRNWIRLRLKEIKTLTKIE